MLMCVLWLGCISQAVVIGYFAWRFRVLRQMFVDIRCSNAAMAARLCQLPHGKNSSTGVLTGQCRRCQGRVEFVYASPTDKDPGGYRWWHMSPNAECVLATRGVVTPLHVPDVSGVAEALTIVSSCVSRNRSAQAEAYRTLYYGTVSERDVKAHESHMHMGNCSSPPYSHWQCPMHRDRPGHFARRWLRSNLLRCDMQPAVWLVVNAAITADDSFFKAAKEREKQLFARLEGFEGEGLIGKQVTAAEAFKLYKERKFPWELLVIDDMAEFDKLLLETIK